MPDLLFLCHRVPHPPDKGEKIRAWHILTHLARTHRVHLGCLADNPADRIPAEAEARHFAAPAPECGERVGWLENGVDLERFSPMRPDPCPYPPAARNLVFTGTMDSWPNGDAVLWFAGTVMPLLRRERPQLRFHIVGANPGHRLLRLRGAPGIEITGRVPDVRPYLAHADVAVAPLRIARGIRNKDWKRWP